LKLESKFDSESFLIKLVKENNRPVIELKIYFWDLLSEFRMAIAEGNGEEGGKRIGCNTVFYDKRSQAY